MYQYIKGSDVTEESLFEEKSFYSIIVTNVKLKQKHINNLFTVILTNARYN